MCRPIICFRQWENTQYDVPPPSAVVVVPVLNLRMITILILKILIYSLGKNWNWIYNPRDLSRVQSPYGNPYLRSRARDLQVMQNGARNTFVPMRTLRYSLEAIAKLRNGNHGTPRLDLRLVRAYQASCARPNHPLGKCGFRHASGHISNFPIDIETTG